MIKIMLEPAYYPAAQLHRSREGRVVPLKTPKRGRVYAPKFFANGFPANYLHGYLCALSIACSVSRGHSQVTDSGFIIFVLENPWFTGSIKGDVGMGTAKGCEKVASNKVYMEVTIFFSSERETHVLRHLQTIPTV